MNAKLTVPASDRRILDAAADLGLTADPIEQKGIPGWLIYRSPYEDILTVLVAPTRMHHVPVTVMVRRMDEKFPTTIPTRDAIAALADL